jgi:hypothetical protein
MTKTIRFAASGLALFAAMGLGTAASAQDSASADATAEVLAALQLTNDRDLNFGSLVINAGGAGGDVLVDAFGNRTCNGDIICGPGATEEEALFTVTGAASTNVSISLQDVLADGVTLRHDANTGSTAANHNIELVALADSVGGSFGSFTGNEQFGVGGRIVLDGSEIAGTYEGQFDVSVEYQ